MTAESAGTLLGGRVAYHQPLQGYRTGIEPVLLAASIAATPGETVLEAGTGAGAGLLCLAARLPGIRGIGVERDPAMAALAKANLHRNGQANWPVICADITAPPLRACCHHALANPPWHDAAGTSSPLPGRAAAKRAHAGLHAAWAHGLALVLRPRGWLTLVLPASGFAAWTGALAASGFGSITLLPLWPHAGQPARLVLLRARSQGRGPSRLLPGLALHDATGAGYTAEARAILRDGAALEL